MVPKKILHHVRLTTVLSAITGRFKVENFDLVGNLVSSLKASVLGRRVGVEPLPDDLD